MARSLVRISVLFVLTALLAAPWCTAAPRQDPEAATPQLLTQLWDDLVDLWSEIGCIMDPDGACRESSSVPAGDIGCIMDPHGGCGH